jgi:hypothetical protein
MSDRTDLGPAPSSYGVDLSAERVLLTTPDVPRLTAQFHRGLRVRSWWRGAVWGAGTGAAIALSLWVLWPVRVPDGERAPPDMQRTTTAALAAPPLVTTSAPLASVPTIAKPDAPPGAAAAASITRERPAPHAHDARETRNAVIPSIAEGRDATPAANGDRAHSDTQREFRLRAQLNLYERARAAHAAGDIDGALRALDELRGSYPGGALDEEARVLRSQLTEAPLATGEPQESTRAIVGGDGR